MVGIFPSVEEIESELGRMRAEREALDAAIAERQLFVELGRRLAGQRRGQGASLVPPPAADGLRAAPAGAPSDDGMIRPVPGDAGPPPGAIRSSEADPALGAPVLPDADAAILTPRTVARARGRELVTEAVAILQEQGRPMHAAELVPLLAERGHALPGRDPVAALNTRLWKRARTGRHVVRHGDAVYAAGETGAA